MSVNLVVAVPTLLGSLSSCIASLGVLVCHAWFHKEKHFRHALIVNLLVADLLNSLNNSVSGIAVLARHGHMLPPGPTCTLNGWLGQITVQTVDFTILAISVVVLLSIKKSHIMSQPPLWKVVLLCISTWIPGIITSCIALILSYYGPVSGNWCWIRPSLLLERYLLTHGWRMAIFIATVVIYVIIYVSLKRLYGKWVMDPSTSSRSGGLSQKETVQSIPHLDIELQTGNSIAVTKVVDIRTNKVCFADSKDGEGETRSGVTGPLSATIEVGISDVTNRNAHGSLNKISAQRRRELRRILLLNGYPIMYIVLWIPGMVNRLVESTHGKTPLWLTVLQASTQFIGLANAITYGWNEGLKQQITAQWRKRDSSQYIRSQG